MKKQNPGEVTKDYEKTAETVDGVKEVKGS